MKGNVEMQTENMVKDITIQFVEIHEDMGKSGAEWISAFRSDSVVRTLQPGFQILLLY